jgi:hypothetical protein
MNWGGPPFTSAQLVTELRQMVDELEEKIDGGEECRGRDSHISWQMEVCRQAAVMLEIESVKRTARTLETK